ncbi:MAG TPA: carbohydrate ABC transporter permease [Streptosporangiaceae bacterium]|nr:carbohydrate ABC transporter permease [Streptosporangiaceae bacterium]
MQTLTASLKAQRTREQTSPPGPSARARRGRRAAGRLVVYLVLCAMALFCVVPFMWVLLGSVDAHASVYLRAPNWTLHNFAEFFTRSGTPQLLVNSIVIAGGGTILCIALAMFSGYAFSRFRFPGRRAVLFGILLIRVIPPTATIAPLYVLVLNLHLNNSYLGIILVEAAFNLPLALWLLKGFFDAIPESLEEAAAVDGASRWGAAIRVIFPLALPGLGASALFTFISIWGDFLTPLVLLQSPSLFPISIGLFQAYVGFNEVKWGLLTATAVIYMIPTVLMYLLVRRYLLRATLSGALKG